MANAIVVVGSQWGDEGKGKVVDIYSRFADLIVRFQGGNNAGHTLVKDDMKVILHHIPSGILYPKKVCILGNGMVIDPSVLLDEIKKLEKIGIQVNAENLKISETAHIIMPYHKALDKIGEAALGKKKIGTTGRGIGPCYEDKAGRRGVRFLDLAFDFDYFAKMVKNRLDYVNPLLEKIGDKPFVLDEMLNAFEKFADCYRQHVTDVSVLIHKEISCGKNILFEGAQGALLDIDHGTYPFVTSSNTVASSACSGTGIGPTNINKVIGICKAYTTRVGSGPFPTELDDEDGNFIREKGFEFGSTTGRPRRCGWLDLVALKKAVRLSGISALAITKLDVLSGLNTLKLCTSYNHQGSVIDNFPARIKTVEELEPVYENIPGWEEDITGVRELSDLPVKTKKYLERIENLIGIPVVLASVGPDRNETIILQNPFR